MLEKNRKILQDELKNVSFDVPLAPLTYYKIGGNADAVVVAETESEIVDAIKLVRELGLPYFVLGCGSNLLISDRGYPGLVIRFGAPFEEINISGTILQAGAAVKLNTLVHRTADLGLSGLEQLAGIPGSVGGAVFMNAGAYESNISDFLMRLRVIELPSLVLTWLDQGAIDFEYRQSSGRLVFLWAEFLLQPSSPEECRRIIADTLAKRGKSQPIDKLSAGCIFKNPPKKHAGALIESLGLKGLASGGAEVSDIHANFIVNTGGATADNVYELIQIIKKAAKLHAGVDLELEVVLKGEFGGKMYL